MRIRVPHPGRWFRATPGRLVLWALVAEGFLLLSERLSWFGLDHHKGWPVLIALATLALAMLLMFLWFAAALVFGLRFQFSVRSLLALMLAVAVACGWFVTEREAAERQRAAATAVAHLRADNVYFWAKYDFEATKNGPKGQLLKAPRPPAPAWLLALLGRDFFADVVEAGVGDPLFRPFQPEPAPLSSADAFCEQVKTLPRLRSLSVCKYPFGGAVLRGVGVLTQLRELRLSNSGAGDLAMECVRKFTGLEVLDLRCSLVTDGGLRDLEGLTCLRELDLWSTRVTDAGMGSVAKLTRLEILKLDYCEPIPRIRA